MSVNAEKTASKEHRLLPLSDVLKSLNAHCQAHESGAFFIATQQGHWAEVVLDEGLIISLRYRAKKGVDAISEIAKVKRAKFSFSPAEDMAVYRVSQSLQMLPATDKILALLEQEVSSVVADDSKPAQVPTAATQQTKTSEFKVLVVEDSTVSRRVITSTLAKKGYHILEAADGFQALAQLSNELPDLVLLDLILPGMDGYKVLANMKKKPSFAEIPVIILTSKDSLFDKLRGKMSGSDEYLTKPFSPSELLEKVEKHLG